MTRYIIAALALIAALTAIFFEGKKAGKETEVIKQQEQQIEIQHEVIETKKEVFKRKEINKSFSSDANLEWLRQARCKDCNS